MLNLKNYIIHQADNLETALKKLDSNAGLTLLVVNDDNRLVGTISDGDVRRSLLRGIHLGDNLAKAMFKNPVVAGSDSTHEERTLLISKHQLDILPIVDSEYLLLDAEIRQMHHISLPNEAFIMCGGLGSRLGELTRNCPKPMLPVAGNPILERILFNLIKNGICKFHFAINYLGEMIEEYFGNGQKWGVEINYIRENKRMGTGGALSLMSSPPADPLIVMNADIQTRFNISYLIDFQNTVKSIATIGIVQRSHQIPYGVIHYDGINLLSIEEKPIQHYYINSGIYIIDKKIFNYIPYNTYIDMPDILIKAKDNGEQISVYPISEDWIDIGRKEEYNLAQKMV